MFVVYDIFGAFRLNINTVLPDEREQKKLLKVPEDFVNKQFESSLLVNFYINVI
jgi:hypothetical protein